MTANEFAAFMSADATVTTIRSAWECYPDDPDALPALRVAWAQLLRLRDPIDALEMVAAEIGDTDDFVAVVL